MTTFVNNNVQSGNVIYASDHNEQGARVAAVLNGNIDDTNVSSLSGSKLADGTVTSAKLADTFVSRQNNTTNTTVAAPRIETGWGWIQNTGGSPVGQLTETVTYSSSFTTRPIVIATYGGDAGNVAPVYGTGTRTAFGNAQANASDITTTNFAITLTFGGSLAVGGTVYYQWIAIGA